MSTRILENNIPAGNWDNKYETKNIIARMLIDNFMNTIKNSILSNKKQIGSITEIGCGEGHLTSVINDLNISKIKACDFSPQIIDIAKTANSAKDIEFYVKSIYDADEAESADLIVCCEVLEHLDDPEKGLEKLKSVANKYILLSVPNEPIWRILNLLRFKYVSALGNTPGHINHWSKKEFCGLVSKHMRIIDIKTPLPWTVLLCEKL